MNFVPKFNGDQRAGPEPQLACPKCGDEGYMHHGEVTVYERREDATKGLRIRIHGENVTIDTTQAGNPSFRRDGLRISFYCENCGDTFNLSLAQHKGQTLGFWREGDGNASP